MYKILTITDDVRVEPVKFDRTPEQGVKESLQETIEGKLNPEAGVFLAVIEVLNIGDGKIIPEDGSIYYPSEFKVLVFRPEQNDITLGEVVDITEFGAFTRIGPMDALVHVSQIMDDKMAYDAKNATFTGKKTGKKLQEGEIVRARIVGVSLGKGRTKISMTMRQPCMGSIDWIDKEKKLKIKEAKTEKKEEVKKKEKK
ncbi:MAG: DNA-directed RNA polymerase [Candidatus Aenigmarchaeota archaeon]|nr:DNA-directed RNA polymerase [Candidatus Aenigmarchaeota archaeon]